MSIFEGTIFETETIGTTIITSSEIQASSFVKHKGAATLTASSNFTANTDYEISVIINNFSSLISSANIKKQGRATISNYSGITANAIILTVPKKVHRSTDLTGTYAITGFAGFGKKYKFVEIHFTYNNKKNKKSFYTESEVDISLNTLKVKPGKTQNVSISEFEKLNTKYSRLKITMEIFNEVK